METERVREHFRVQVSDYGSLMARLIPFYDEQRNLMLGLIPFGRQEALRVLDLGCGPGLMAARLLTEFPRSELTVFDLTAEMIEACRVRLGQHDRIRYLVGDFRSDDFGRGYDFVVASLSLHHLELSERLRFFKRVHDALKPGGYLVAAEIIVDESPVVRDQQYALWRQFMRDHGEDGDTWY